MLGGEGPRFIRHGGGAHVTRLREFVKERLNVESHAFKVDFNVMFGEDNLSY